MAFPRLARECLRYQESVSGVRKDEVGVLFDKALRISEALLRPLADELDDLDLALAAVSVVGTLTEQLLDELFGEAVEEAARVIDAIGFVIVDGAVAAGERVLVLDRDLGLRRDGKRPRRDLGIVLEHHLVVGGNLVVDERREALEHSTKAFDGTDVLDGEFHLVMPFC